MSVSLLIQYKTPGREDLHHPFSFQVVMRAGWWPLAERLRLETLQRLEVLHITERPEAEALITELQAAKQYLLRTDAPWKPGDAEYMLMRADQVLPILEHALEEWDQVELISL